MQPDVLASNGVVHGITRVLFPPPVFNKSMYETLLTGDQLSELVPGMPGSKSSGAAAGPGGAGMIPGVPGLKPGMGVPTMMLPNASSPDAATKQQPPVKAQG